MTASPRDVSALRLQRAFGWLALPLISATGIFYLRVVRNTRIDDLREVRRRFREIAQTDRPILICANHLTMIDSLYLLWALASPVSYVRQYRRFAWNVPASENFQRGAALRLMSYLGKTVPIDRAGSSAHHRSVLEKLAYLLREGDSVMIFPEAGRSRTGRVEPEKVAYGVGRLLRDVPEALVLCVYQRGARQETWGFQPAWGDRIHVELETLEPKATTEGLRATRELSRQIILRLKAMEDRYFEQRSAPHASAPDAPRLTAS